ncbi:MAG TPA: hypothetical protein VGK96_28405 [Candidatus Sulfotelmatobacter sp.]|jgi:hypothetical protein
MLLRLALLVWILSLIGNVVLALFLVCWRYYIQWGWLTISTIAAVFCDFLLFKCHFLYNPAYEHLRFFIFYVLFWVLDALVIWEAYRLRNKLVQTLVEIQLGLALAGMLLKHLPFPWTAYYLELFARFFNLIVIVLLLNMFHRRSDYAPR